MSGLFLCPLGAQSVSSDPDFVPDTVARSGQAIREAAWQERAEAIVVLRRGDLTEGLQILEHVPVWTGTGAASGEHIARLELLLGVVAELRDTGSAQEAIALAGHLLERLSQTIEREKGPAASHLATLAGQVEEFFFGDMLAAYEWYELALEHVASNERARSGRTRTALRMEVMVSREALQP